MAQARHRAKRKAYIEQLEQTVTKLQTVLALSPDQVAAIPPPLMRIRELEQENNELQRENEYLRRELESRNAQLRPDIGRRGTLSSLNDDRRNDRDIKRRRTLDQQGDSIYMNSSNAHSPHISSPAPPPLTIPSLNQPYSSSNSSLSHRSSSSSSSLMPSYGLPYIPGTPSASSSTSSPSTQSFSQPTDPYPSSHQRHSSSSSSNHTVLPPFSQTIGQYDVVKIEEDSLYAQQQQQQHNGIHHTSTYANTLPPFHANHQPWHPYDRT
ncbi:hypothetical protein C8Q75DRAFT_463531 [Abortiporus biennis]|nr:hypothetical protein C8Q75DRAFT_463531 [Abortiporus biennis]